MHKHLYKRHVLFRWVLRIFLRLEQGLLLLTTYGVDLERQFMIWLKKKKKKKEKEKDETKQGNNDYGMFASWRFLKSAPSYQIPDIR